MPLGKPKLDERQIRYIANEVARQGRGPVEVANLCDAWIDAIELRNIGDGFNLADIIRWGHMIEPEALNRHNYWRGVHVSIGHAAGAAPVDVPGMMERWYENVKEKLMTPAIAYREFEVIHPFADGNGRAGKIIYNFLTETLDDPRMPPNFWNVENP